MVVFVVMTDDASRGGGLYTIKATEAEAIEAALKLVSPAEAQVFPWLVGSESYDADYMQITFGRGLVGYDSFAKVVKPDI